MTPSLLKVRLYGDPCLRRKAQKVETLGPNEQMLIQEMFETMYHYKGIGLAAPQVGVDQRIFVVDIGDGPIAIINPEVLARGGSQVLEEGCLSIPGVNVKVKRPFKIKVRYVDAQNNIVERELEDLMARVFLHENDHLNGKLILDYATLNEKLKSKPALQEIKRKRKEKDV